MATTNTSSSGSAWLPKLPKKKKAKARGWATPSNTTTNTNTSMVWNPFSRMKTAASDPSTSSSSKAKKRNKTLFQSRRRRSSQRNSKTLSDSGGGVIADLKIAPASTPPGTTNSTTITPVVEVQPSASPSERAAVARTPDTVPHTPDDDDQVREYKDVLAPMIEDKAFEATPSPRALFSLTSPPSPPTETMLQEEGGELPPSILYEDKEEQEERTEDATIREQVNVGPALILDRPVTTSTKSSNKPPRPAATIQLPWKWIGQAMGAVLATLCLAWLVRFVVRVVIRVTTRILGAIVVACQIMWSAGVQTVTQGGQLASSLAHQVLWYVLLTGWYYIAWKTLQDHYLLTNGGKVNGSEDNNQVKEKNSPRGKSAKPRIRREESDFIKREESGSIYEEASEEG
jgi:hypothetical protein